MIDWTARRNIFLGVCLLSLVALALRLAWMQLVQVDDYRRLADQNQIRMLPIAAPRGRIVDRNGVDLVRNRPSFTISVLPTDFRGAAPKLRLASALGIDDANLSERLKHRPGLPLEPVWIERDADLRLISRLEEHMDEFPGVIIANEPVREYPTAAWGGHVLGYVREVSEDDATRIDRSGAPLRGLVGATGLEKRYDDILRGTDGISYRQINAFGQMLGAMPGYPNTPPTAGDDLMLGLDGRLQNLADSLLADHPAGTVVAMDVHTGEILCLVTRPGFDANAFSGGMTAAEWETLRDDTLKPLLNRAAMGLYTAGSTAKLLTAASALEEGVANENTVMPSGCHGVYRFGNRLFHCWKPAGHGSLSLLGAIENSCNIYFYQLGPKVGLEFWSREANAAGFGHTTGIDLPSENTGIVPDKTYLDKVRGKGGWGPGVMLNYAIGQGEFTVTPLQVVMFYDALANNGVAMKPHLAVASRTPGSDWQRVQPEVAYRLDYKPSTLATLREGCRLVVEAGTAAGIRDDSVRMAGKTGTAQNPHGKEHAWFAGWAPYENPQIAVCALVENAGHGSVYAAPICLKIAKGFLYPETLNPPPPAEDSTAAAPADSAKTAPTKKKPAPSPPTASIRP
jgi:penicillin-binding protein 2